MSKVAVVSCNAIASIKLECTRGEMVSLMTGEIDCLDVNEKVRVIKTFRGCDVYCYISPDNEVVLSMSEDECSKMMDYFLSTFRSGGRFV